MKFIHIADVHLGARPEAGRLLGQRRTKEIWNALERIIKKCKEEQVDLLLIAGDLFHRQPLLRELKEVNYLFSTIPNTRVVLTAGNHDYMRKDSYYRTFVWADNVQMIKTGLISYAEIPSLKTAVYGLSYVTREISDARYDIATPQHKQKYEILLAHGGDEKHIPIHKQKLLQSGFDYIALGHIHKPQILSENLAYYAGALEPVDKNDVGPHGYVQGVIDGKGCRAEFIPDAVREYIHMDVQVNKKMTSYELMEKVRNQMQEHGAQNIYKITLKGFRDPEMQYNYDSIENCGNIVEIVDVTKPAYDFEKLQLQNADNILGAYIENLREYDEDSIEYLALCAGVQALMETRRD